MPEDAIHVSQKNRHQLLKKKKNPAVKHPVEELHPDVAKASLEEPQTEARSTITFIHFVLQYYQLETCNPKIFFKEVSEVTVGSGKKKKGLTSCVLFTKCWKALSKTVLESKHY